MQHTSIEELSNSRRGLEVLLRGFNLTIGKESWLEYAYNLIDNFSKLYKDDHLRKEFQEKQDQQRNLFYAISDVLCIKDALSCIAGQDNAIVKKKLKDILRLGSPYAETTLNNQARNTLWELDLFSRLKEADISAWFKDPNPDILMRADVREYHIECKRLFIDKKTTLRGRIKDALVQLQKGLTQKDANTFGIIAVSFERLLNQFFNKPMRISERDGKALLSTFLKEIVRENNYLWQNPVEVKDRRIIGVFLYVSTLMPFIEQDGTLARASYMLLTETCFGGTLRFAAQDFDPLKQHFGS